MNAISRGIRRFAQSLGYALTRCQRDNGLPLDFTASDVATVQAVTPFTKTTPERLHSFIESVRYVVQHDIPGAIVECGVWRGGSMMAAARTLVELGITDRDLYLYDTYTGMTAPGEEDVSRFGTSASSKFEKRATGEDASDWCLAGLDDVRSNLGLTGYPMDRIHFIAGKVEDTLPAQAPERVAILRLDTDWYSSTKHELDHLYPRLSEGGVLTIDDYGDWLGARKAVEEYLAEHRIQVMLQRIDDSARLFVKPHTATPG